MSHSDLILINSFINENMANSIHPMKTEDERYQPCPKGFLNELMKNSEDFQEKPTCSSYSLEQTPILDKVEPQCSLTIDKNEKSLTKFEDFKNFTNDLNSGASTAIFNPFSFIPFLKESQVKRSVSKESTASQMNMHFFSKNSSFSTTLSRSTSKSSFEDEFDSASEKEQNCNNYNNSKKIIKNNQPMTPSVVSTRSCSDTLSVSLPDIFYQDPSENEQIKSKLLLENISRERSGISEVQLKEEEQINISTSKKLISKFSNKKRDRGIQEDTSSTTNSSSKLIREEGIFIIQKNFYKRKRKNKFQKVMDLLKDSMLSHSHVKDSMMQNIKDNLTIYSQDEYLIDLEKIKNDEGHCLMKKNFPNAYTRANFYKSFKFVELRRKEKKKKIFLQDDILNTIYNPILTKKEEKNYFLFNQEDSSQAKFLPKKIWSPCEGNDSQEFIDKIAAIWPHNKFLFSEEFLLEYLLCLNNDYELVYENVLNESVDFKKFLKFKKNDEINIFHLAISEKELTLNLKGESISSNNYYLRKR